MSLTVTVSKLVGLSQVMAKTSGQVSGIIYKSIGNSQQIEEKTPQ